MTGNLAGRVAIVTGAGGGLGSELAAGLAEAGAIVCVADIDLNAASATAKTIGGSVFAAEVDISSNDSVSFLIETVAERAGLPEVVINNAAYHSIEPWAEISQSDFKRAFAVNVWGLVAMCQAVLPLMMKQRRGAIINIASQTGQRPNPRTPIYSASKAAGISLTQSLALVAAPYGIRVNGIAPGGIETQMYAKAKIKLEEREPGLLDSVEKTIPMSRLSRPADYRALALYLASDDSSYVTGQTFNVNGGTLLS